MGSLSYMVVIYFNQLFGHNRPPMLVYVTRIFSYILKHYGAQSTVVFDGYGSTTLTKVAEQRRRAQKCTSVDIIFHDDMPTTTTQAAFLTNGNNKKRLIESLREKMLQ